MCFIFLIYCGKVARHHPFFRWNSLMFPLPHSTKFSSTVSFISSLDLSGTAQRIFVNSSWDFSDILDILTHFGTKQSWSISLYCVLASITTWCIAYLLLQYGAPLDPPNTLNRLSYDTPHYVSDSFRFLELLASLQSSVILQIPKTVVRFTSVTPWQSAINSISFLSDMLSLPNNLTFSSNDRSRIHALPFYSWKLGRYPTSSNRLESSPLRGVLFLLSRYFQSQ